MRRPARALREDDLFWLALLALALLLAAILRLTGLSQESFWTDEAHSVLSAGFPEVSPGLESALERGPHPPLFFYLLRGWLRVFPADEGSLRLLPALCGTLAIPAVWAFGRALRLPRPACALGAFFLALNPHSIWYSQELRMYSLEGLLGLLHLAAGARLARPVREGRAGLAGPLAAWLATGVALLYTHFYALFYLAVGAVGLALVVRRRWSAPPKALGRLAARGTLLAARESLAVAGLAAAAWLAVGGPVFLDLVSRARTGAGVNWLDRLYRLSWKTPGEIFEGLICGPQIAPAPVWMRIAAVAGLLLLVALGASAPRHPARPRLGGVRLSRLWPSAVALLLIAMPTLVSFWRVIILGGDRYLEVAVGPLCLAAGVGTWVAFHRHWSVRALAVAALILVVACQSTYLAAYFGGREKRMFRETVAIMMEGRNPEDVYVANDVGERLAIEFYSHGRVRFAGTEPPATGAVWSYSIVRAPTALERRLLDAGWRPEKAWEVEKSWPSTYLRLTRFVKR